MGRIVKKLAKRHGAAIFVAIGLHIALAIALGFSIMTRVKKPEEPRALVVQREFALQEYDATLKRAIFRTPGIEGEKMAESPIIITEEEVEITKDIPRGTSFDNLSNKNLDSTNSCDAYGVGGGGHAGAYGRRFGKGSMARQQSSSTPPVCGGSKTPNKEPYDATFFKHYGVNPEIQTDDKMRSTFGLDVDTASYTIFRNYVKDGNVPPEEAIRVEEFVNFFDYNYKAPSEETFAVHLHAGRTPFLENNRVLLRIGIKAKEIRERDRKDAVLTFVIDTSGSMSGGNRLEMVKTGLRMLLSQLRNTDKVAIVEYNTSANLVLPHVDACSQRLINSCMSRLRPSGSTNAYAGLMLGYQQASKNFDKDCINKVILCSDGVANQQHTDAETILEKVERYKKKEITLFAVGVGMNNYNDVLLEKLGDKGDGHYAYIDSYDEARRVFVDNVTGTLQTVAKDAKVQVKFNPDTVVSYRLLGYENRKLKNKDFRNDKVDSGDVGAGHSVTALYAVKLKPEESGRLATVRLRWKDVDGECVKEGHTHINTTCVTERFDKAPESFRLAAVVAQFAEILRKSFWADEDTSNEVARHVFRLACDTGDENLREFSRLADKAFEIKRNIKTACEFGER